MLLLLAFLSGILAEYPSPKPNAVPREFLELYIKCDLQQYVPEGAIGAKIWILELDAEKRNETSAVEYRLEFNGLIKTISRKSIYAKNISEGIWSHDLRKIGLFEKRGDDFHFFWHNDPNNTINMGQNHLISYFGFAREDYVYTMVQFHDDLEPRFARFRVDLTGGVEIFGAAKKIDDYFQFIEPNGPAYYLEKTKCNELKEFSSLKMDINHLSDCDGTHGMFGPIDFETIYGMTLFAFLTKDCSVEAYTKHWCHWFAKVQFIPSPTSIATTTTTATSQMTTTTTTPMTTGTTTINWTTTTESTTMIAPTMTLPTTPLPAETSTESTDPPKQVCPNPNTSSFYAIAISTIVAFCALLSTASGVLCFFMGKRYQKKKNQLRQENLSHRKEVSTYTTTTIGDSTNISRMETVAPISSKGSPANSVTKVVLSPEVEKLFDQNEVEGVEAELPKKALERAPEPREGLFVTFAKIGVTIPAKTFDKTFGEFEMEMGGEVCTVQYEDVKCELNRIDAMVAIMKHAKEYQKNGTIPELISTVKLDNLHFRLLVTKKLGPSIEKQVLSGTMSIEEKLNLVSMTSNCMEDLLFCSIIHRDIKPSSFHYDYVGSKILVSNLGLARITPKSPRLKLPFFGNLTFCSLSTHLKLERTHFDDMISYFFVVLWIFNKDLLIWSKEDDRTVVYQLKSDLMEGRVFEDRLEKFIQDEKIKDFLSKLFRLILKLPAKQPSYRQIKELIEKSMENINPTKS